MPIFEYHCNACKAKFEVLQRTNDTKKTLKCPDCGTEDTKKRFSAFTSIATRKETAKDNST